MTELNGIKWIDYHKALIPDMPPHINIDLTQSDISHLLKKSHSYFIRWTDNWDCNDASEFWYVIKDNQPSMDELSSNTRSKVRRGLKRCYVEIVDTEYMAKHGYDVYKAAFERYDKEQKPASINKYQKEKFDKDFLREYWMVTEKNSNKCIAYSQNMKWENCIGIRTLKFHPEYLNLYPSYALFYIMNEHYLNELKLDYITNGTRSLSHETNMQDFLIDKFKYRKAYCRLQIAYSKKIKTAVSILYPFRNILKKMHSSFIDKVNLLLFHEKLRRSYKRT